MKFSALAFLPFAHASFPRIAGYEPGSQVTDHNAMDLDQAALEKQLALGTDQSFDHAQRIYNEGAHSKSYAQIILVAPGLTSDVKSGDEITGVGVDGLEVKAKAHSNAQAGSTTLKVRYATYDVQDDHVRCKVGALPVADQTHDGCLEASGSITTGGKTYAYNYNIETDNKNSRTIAEFSKSANSKMLVNSAECPGCPYKEFMKFYGYYGEAEYAHEWVQAAFDGGRTTFSNGNADFGEYGLTGRTEAIKKGTAYMSIYMYVIREFEDAIDDCNNGCMECNYGSVHAWDEGVAFYTGSMEGADGAGDGKLLHALADKRCNNYKTCGVNGDELEGLSKVNYDLFELFTVGQYHLQIGQCDAVRPVVDEIVNLMSVPLVQGTLRYSYKVDKLSGAEKEKAEGAVFAASVLPRVYDCSKEDAAIIYNNMKVGASSTDHAAVKKAFENNFNCMGINGAMVGGLWNTATESYYEGAEPKKDGSTGGRNNTAIGLGVGFGIAGVVGIAFVIHMIRKEKQGKPIFMETKEGFSDTV